VIATEVVIEIPFHDVDLMAVAWHGHYVKYLEIARCALLDKIDYNYMQMKKSGYVWPVVDLHLRYIQPLRFQQKIKVTAEVIEWENRFKINYLIEDLATGKRLTKAHTIQVAIDLNNNEMCYESPAILYHKLGLSL